MKQHYFIDKYANESIAIKIVDFVENSKSWQNVITIVSAKKPVNS